MTLLVVTFLLFVLNTNCQLPAAGAFVAFRSDFIASLGANMSQKLQALVNADKPADINGKSGKTTYTLSSIRLSSSFGGFYLKDISPKSIRIGWSAFTIGVHMNYHMCVKIIIGHVCEHGTIDIVEPSGGLDIGLVADFSGPTVHVSPIDVNLQHSRPSVSVHCSSTICAIPKKDIENPIMSEFSPLLVKSITSGINDIAKSSFNTIPTNIPVPGYPFSVNIASSYYMIGSTLVFATQATIGKAPYSPNFAPPASAFNSLPDQVSVAMTSYPPDCFLWEMNQMGFFNRNENSNYTTDSFLLKLIFPGFKNYPGMNVTFTTTMTSNAMTKIDSKGVWFDLNVRAEIILKNASLTVNAATLDYHNKPCLAYTLQSQANNNIFAVLSMSNSTSSFTVVKSAIGTINTAPLVVQADAAVNAYKNSKDFAFGHSDVFAFSQLSHQFMANYDLLSMKLKVYI